MQTSAFSPRSLRQSIVVKAAWDDSAGVWVAESDDIAGLATEATTFDGLREKVLRMIPELIELNGFDSDLPQIPVHILAQQTSLVANTAQR